MEEVNCVICTKYTTRLPYGAWTLRRHIERHFGIKRFLCLGCNKYRSNEQNNLKYHIKRRHKEYAANYQAFIKEEEISQELLQHAKEAFEASMATKRELMIYRKIVTKKRKKRKNVAVNNIKHEPSAVEKELKNTDCKIEPVEYILAEKSATTPQLPVSTIKLEEPEIPRMEISSGTTQCTDEQLHPEEIVVIAELSSADDRVSFADLIVCDEPTSYAENPTIEEAIQYEQETLLNEKMSPLKKLPPEEDILYSFHEERLNGEEYYENDTGEYEKLSFGRECQKTEHLHNGYVTEETTRAKRLHLIGFKENVQPTDCHTTEEGLCHICGTLTDC